MQLTRFYSTSCLYANNGGKLGTQTASSKKLSVPNCEIACGNNRSCKFGVKESIGEDISDGLALNSLVGSMNSLVNGFRDGHDSESEILTYAFFIRLRVRQLHHSNFEIYFLIDTVP